MRKYQGLIILLTASCAIVSCAALGPSRSSTFVTKADQGVHSEINGDAGKCGDCEMSSDRFMVFYTLDYGYRLNPENDLDTIITPEFDGPGVEQAFNQFFSVQNLGLNVGKKIYCDCVGERYVRGGEVFYKIREARLFAK